MRFYTVVFILWYGTCFEIDMNLYMDKFILWYHYCLWKVLYHFSIDIWYISSVCGMWCICIFMYPL